MSHFIAFTYTNVSNFYKNYIIGLRFGEFWVSKIGLGWSLGAMGGTLRYTPVRVFRIEQKSWPETGRFAGLIDPCAGRVSRQGLAI